MEVFLGNMKNIYIICKPQILDESSKAPFLKGARFQRLLDLTHRSLGKKKIRSLGQRLLFGVITVDDSCSS